MTYEDRLSEGGLFSLEKTKLWETNHSPSAPARRLQGKQSLVPKELHGGTQRQYT